MSSCNSSFQELNIFRSASSISHILKSSSQFSILCSMCPLPRIFSKYHNSGHLMPECLSNSSFLTLDSHLWHQLCAHSTTVKRWTKYRWQLSKVPWEYHIYSTIWQVEFIQHFCKLRADLIIIITWNHRNFIQKYIFNSIQPCFDLCIICGLIPQTVWPSTGTPKNEW